MCDVLATMALVLPMMDPRPVRGNVSCLFVQATSPYQIDVMHYHYILLESRNEAHHSAGARHACWKGRRLRRSVYGGIAHGCITRVIVRAETILSEPYKVQGDIRRPG